MNDEIWVKQNGKQFFNLSKFRIDDCAIDEHTNEYVVCASVQCEQIDNNCIVDEFTEEIYLSDKNLKGVYHSSKSEAWTSAKRYLINKIENNNSINITELLFYEEENDSNIRIINNLNMSFTIEENFIDTPLLNDPNNIIERTYFISTSDNDICIIAVIDNSSNICKLNVTDRFLELLENKNNDSVVVISKSNSNQAKWLAENINNFLLKDNS